MKISPYLRSRDSVWKFCVKTKQTDPAHSAPSLTRAQPEPQGRLPEAARGGEGDVGRRPPLAGRRTPRSSRRHGRRVQPPGTNVKRSNISSPPEWSDFT